MSATAAHGTQRQGAAANRHLRSDQPSREELHRENERRLRENQELRRKVAEREEQIAHREKQIADAEKQIADLERQLAGREKNSTNSSKPSSTLDVGGEQRPRGRKHKSKRKPGAPPGHPGHHRPLVPSVEANVIEVLLPEQCGHCGGSLPQKPDKVTTAGEPRRHQVTEVPR
jgi:transposase